jgi:hypothetical protein
VRLPLLDEIGGAQSAHDRQRQYCPGQPHLELAPPPFLHGACQGHGPLALGGAQLLLYARQIGHHPLRHRPGVARSVGRRGGDTVAGQSHEVGVRPTRGQPRAGVGRVAAQRLAEDLVTAGTGVNRLAAENLAEDRTEPEDVGPLIHLLEGAGRLLGGHVRRRPQHAAGARLVLARAAPRRPDHALRRRY